MQLARKHGIAISGAGRPMGAVSDDRSIGYVEPKIFPPAKFKPRDVVRKANPPAAWGAAAKMRRETKPRRVLDLI